MTSSLQSSATKNDEQPTYNVGFLLLDNFTMIALASAVETLRMANQLSGKALYNWTMISETGESVSASDGMTFTPDFSCKDAKNLDLVVVAGGIDITHSSTPKQLSWLQGLARQKVRLGGICTGSYVLAKASLLEGYECSAHWECMAALQEHFPRVHSNSRLFSVDRDRMTSSGGNAPMDMFLHMIAMQHGAKLSSAICDMFICDRIRNEYDQQRVPLRHVHGGESKPKLVDVIELMENNLEEPIELDELAQFVTVSRRQLERMFLKYLSCSPSRYYLRLRLDRARQLLKQSSLSIVEIAAACGFVSTPHFSRCYRKHIGISPREERKIPSIAANGLPTISSPLDNKRLVARPHAFRSLSSAKVEPSFGTVALG